MFHKFWTKCLNEFASMKYQLIFTATGLFYAGKLSESGWITFVLSMTGIRVINEVSSMVSDVQKAKDALNFKGKKIVGKDATN